MIITLLIGFFLGILISAQLRHKRMRPLRIYSSEQQFKESIYRHIQPNEDQVEVLDEIISRYGMEGSDLQRNFRKEFEDLMTNFWDELKPELTEEQINSMDETLKQRRDAMRRFRYDSSSSRGNRHSRQRGDRQKAPCDSIIAGDSLMIKDSVKSEI